MISLVSLDIILYSCFQYVCFFAVIEVMIRVWFILVLWHINLCRIFNVKSIFYTYKQFYFKQFSLA